MNTFDGYEVFEVIYNEQIVEILKECSYCKTYKVKMKGNGEEKVMKIVNRNVLNVSEVEDFFFTVRLINRLSSKYLMKCEILPNENENLCLIMPKYEMSLQNLINENYKLLDLNIFDLMISLCEGTKVLHDKKILNGNIKPSNILFNKTEDEIFIVSDYCERKILKMSDYILTKDNIIYSSPEILESKEYDKSCDIWSIGCIFYQLISNENAFEGENVFEILSNIKENRYKRYEGIDDEIVNELCGKLIENNPKKRLKIEELLCEMKSIFIIDYYYFIKQN